MTVTAKVIYGKDLVNCKPYNELFWNFLRDVSSNQKIKIVKILNERSGLCLEPDTK